MKLADSADLICSSVVITIISTIQLATSSLSVLNKRCKGRGSLSSTVCGFFFFLFLIWRDVSLPSHPFHLSAALAPVIMVPLGHQVQAASPVYICTSSPLSPCPSSALPSAIKRLWDHWVPFSVTSGDATKVISHETFGSLLLPQQRRKHGNFGKIETATESRFFPLCKEVT